MWRERRVKERYAEAAKRAAKKLRERQSTATWGLYAQYFGVGCIYGGLPCAFCIQHFHQSIRAAQIDPLWLFLDVPQRSRLRVCERVDGNRAAVESQVHLWRNKRLLSNQRLPA